MTLRQLKLGYFVLEGLNSFATTLFFYYLFFYTRAQYGFGNADNLWLSALNGFIYMFAAWFAGQFAQRCGYFLALRLGFGIMAIALTLGSQIHHALGPYATVVFWTLGMCFTWPTLEALVSGQEPPDKLPQMVGRYNVVWAGASALAYFTGGALLKLLGPQALFWLPVGIHVVQFLGTVWLERQATAIRIPTSVPAPPLAEPDPLRVSRSMSPQAFMRMAWVANPFAYVAINTVIAIIPELAAQLKLSLTLAGFVGSVWLFARLAAFYALWQWTGWHYRFRWLLGAYALTIASFLLMLLVPRLWVLVSAQILFGFSVGLIYYSSLYYSMDVGEASGAHGGFHEAALGVGIFAGPAVGATTLFLFPHYASSGAWAVSGLLLVGGMLIVGIKACQPGRGRVPETAAANSPVKPVASSS